MAYEREIRVTGDTSRLDQEFEKSGRVMGDVIQDVDKKMSDMTGKMEQGIDNLTLKQREQAMVTKELYQGLLQDAEKVSESKKKQLEYVEREIKQIERLNVAEAKSQKERAKERYEQEKERIKKQKPWDSANQMSSARESFDTEMADIESRKKASEEQARNLKNKVEADKQVINEEEDGDGSDGSGTYKKTNSRAGQISRAGRTAFNAAAGAAGFGAVLSIAGFIGKMVSEGSELDVARARKSAGGFTGGGGIDGMKEADFLIYQGRVARAMGMGAGSGGAASRIGALERGTGMDLGSTIEFSRNLRSESGGKDISRMTEEMLAIMKDSDLYNISKGDFTMTHELLQRANELNEMQGSHMEEINSQRSSELMAAFAGAGGSFKDVRQTATLGKMNEAIRNPQNDFTRAFIMRAIKAGGGQSSLLDIMKMQEEGIFGEGMMSNIMGGILGMGGGHDREIFNTSKILGLGLHQSEALMGAYRDNPNMFSGVHSKDDLDKIIKDMGVADRSGMGTGDTERWLAAFNTTMGEWGDTAIDKIDTYLTAFKDGSWGGLTNKLTEDIVGAIKSGFMTVYEEITGANDTSSDEIPTSVSKLVRNPINAFKFWYLGQAPESGDTQDERHKEFFNFKNKNKAASDFLRSNPQAIEDWTKTGETDNKQLQKIIELMTLQLSEQKKKPIEKNAETVAE